ncbi:M55 family metallopeptidase [Brevibacillus sp. SYP-B805]|uniref:M55 family metallopeptidase n=1 Tax=Brevibacillus sp. SYP-B805 TaxID=1578199 RepID=UPI0013EB6D97|nr:M55 family metallopeptidase [Brevibacillus sp. SYP-B805]NGQ94436.1 M55 family metallopeptidase [Brevibacillus sp. SYP-B805]
MKLFISADMEGSTGIIDPSYCNPGANNYERGRRLMTADVNAVVEAALAAGATEIVVADSHHKMNNILIEELHPGATLLCGSPRDHSMMQGLDSTFDAAFFLGYHSRHGMPGVLSHTMSGAIKNMYINGRVVGEFGFNAIYAGHYGVPVCLVSGDDQIAQEAKELIPAISTAVVKTATSRTSAICLPPAASANLLRQATQQALARVREIKPLQVSLPLELTIEFAHTGQAEMAAIIPGASLRPGTTEVTCLVEDPREMYKTMRAMLNLAGTAEFF